MPWLKQPLDLVIISIRRIGQIFQKFSSKAYSEKYEPTDEEIQEIQKYLVRDLPWQLSYKICLEILEVMKKIIATLQSNDINLEATAYFTDDDGFGKIVLSILTPYIQKLDTINTPWYLKRMLLFNLSKFKFARKVIIENPVDEMMILKLEEHIPTLKYLVYFQMRNTCTDEIMNIIGMNCKQLKFLDVTESRKVTDNSVMSLTKMHRLEGLYLCGTSITSEGFADFIGLSRETDIYTKQLKILSIGSEDKWMVNTGDINLVTKLFNELIGIHFRSLDIQSDYSSLESLENLTNIKISHTDFYLSNVNIFISSFGNRITSLLLLEVNNVDLDCILVNCCRLRILKIYTGSMYLTNMEQDCSFSESLRIIQLYGTGIDIITAILKACKNIQQVLIACFENVDDAEFSTLMSKCCFKKLRLIAIFSPNTVTLSTLRSLANECPALETIVFLEETTTLKEADLEYFLNELSGRNLGITAKLMKNHIS